MGRKDDARRMADALLDGRASCLYDAREETLYIPDLDAGGVPLGLQWCGLSMAGLWQVEHAQEGGAAAWGAFETHVARCGGADNRMGRVECGGDAQGDRREALALALADRVADPRWASTDEAGFAPLLGRAFEYAGRTFLPLPWQYDPTLVARKPGTLRPDPDPRLRRTGGFDRHAFLDAAGEWSCCDLYADARTGRVFCPGTNFLFRYEDPKLLSHAGERQPDEPRQAAVWRATGVAARRPTPTPASRQVDGLL